MSVYGVSVSWLLSFVVKLSADTCHPEDLFDTYSAQACKSATPSPVAFWAYTRVSVWLCSSDIRTPSSVNQINGEIRRRRLPLVDGSRQTSTHYCKLGVYPGASIPMGQRGHIPPIFGLGDIITNVPPPNISTVISATCTFYPCNIFLISWKSF